jgi:hypothetical protein
VRTGKVWTERNSLSKYVGSLAVLILSQKSQTLDN